MPVHGTLDRYIAKQTVSAFAAVFAIVMSLMTLEHLPSLIELARFSGSRGYVVAQSLAGLLPEYGGIGLLVGLYLALALLVRKLVLRGELDAIEASGIGPLRWMRLPIVMTLVVAGLTLFNQGWLMPDAERSLEDVGERMASGEFGHNLAAGQFIDLGKGSILRFDSVAPDGRFINGIFLRTNGRTFTAQAGRLSLQSDGSVMLDLRNGQTIEEDRLSTGSFAQLKFASEHDKAGESKTADGSTSAKFSDLDTLLKTDTAQSRSAAYARLLWVLLVPVSAAMAFVLGKPPKRSTSAMGLFLGIIALITCLKMLSPLDTGVGSNPSAFAFAIAAVWLALAVWLLRAEDRLGRGFVDGWLERIFLRLRMQFTSQREWIDAEFGKDCKVIVDR